MTQSRLHRGRYFAKGDDDDTFLALQFLNGTDAQLSFIKVLVAHPR